jgi:hypothetical protein
MLCLILNPKFKNIRLVFWFIGCEERVNIVEKYYKWTLYPMLLKCYHYLHLIVEFEVGCAN